MDANALDTAGRGDRGISGLTINALADRSIYPSLNDCVYLNQASLGLIGQPAVQSMHEFLDDVARR